MINDEPRRRTADFSAWLKIIIDKIYILLYNKVRINRIHIASDI